MTDPDTLPITEGERPERDAARTIWLERFGDLDVLHLQDRPVPQPVDDEVLVRVRAASINPVDWKIAAGQYPPKPADQLPFALGRDLAGTIEAVGTRAHNMLSHGDRVFAFIGQDRGAQSDYVVVRATELVAMPGNMDFESAAAIPLAAMTAWQGLLVHGGLQAGQRVLIHGAAGGVGHLAVQIARWKGATVFATAGTDDLDYVRSIGADTVIDYKNERFEDVATELDLVFDTQGGETQARSFGCIRPGGCLVSTLEPDEQAAAEHGVRVPPRWHAEPNAAQLGEIAKLLEAGTLRVEVARSFPIEEFDAAYRFARDGHPRGKVVLTLD
ncbi:NADP-dependent oxidoreductase [Sphingomonas aracearum]|uniref:NADP-dependent oxidoreductase n=1 Tax=Sphingomonas aracearum TaxID=2283317 RepID=A0A369VVG2_9SPHN|nr:NADP-dependent oxidoreductase [Sphingomonas aracearum]RDE05160.1 NADP-dependent oxidoreductase [Sphingomonas aracearum]